MKFIILSLFPEMTASYFETSIVNRAVEQGQIEFELINIRDFANNERRDCDDYPYGGGPGMILKPEPIALAFDSLNYPAAKKIYPSPGGKLFNQKKAEQLSREKTLIFLCGRYEGVDQRIIDEYIDEELSIGDYVISSGELASLVIIDSIYRLLSGVINRQSLEEESFQNGLVEYPQYTRPETFKERSVPPVLLSGHHRRVQQWRRQEALRKTALNRPDLLDRNNSQGRTPG